MVTNSPTKFEQNQWTNLWGVSLTKSSVTNRWHMDRHTLVYLCLCLQKMLPANIDIPVLGLLLVCSDLISITKHNICIFSLTFSSWKLKSFKKSYFYFLTLGLVIYLSSCRDYRRVFTHMPLLLEQDLKKC